MAWKFEPFVTGQHNPDFEPFFEGPTFGLKIVTCPNERGVAVYLGWWIVQLTWFRWPNWPYCEMCGQYHAEDAVLDQFDLDSFVCPCGDPSCDYGF